ncbi:cadherin-like beta sandwich domain-containing protein [Mucilaginibacter sp. FT3.2]|uniref:cadherin-like beta sandwich domain-containing protein n=1 Tax=Mucilaginibacter sp. FT3.2 TaxID=2723090 RepID=UPI003B00B90A
MKELLLLLKNLLTKDLGYLSIALILLVLLGISNKSGAQVYYMTNDAVSGTASTVDGINRMDYSGSNATLLANSFTPSPGIMEVDLPNNRAFVYEAFSTSPPNGLSIKVVNLTTGAVTATIPITGTGARCYAIKYDPINDYIYYVVADSSPTTATADDALYKVKPDGTGKTTVVSGFATNPNLLALDILHNKAYVYNQLVAGKFIYTINLATSTATKTGTITAATTGVFSVNDMAYDYYTDYIYYLSSNGATSTNANDALNKIHPDGTGYVVVTGVAQSPTLMAVDFGNNRAFVFDNVAPARTISTIDLTAGTTTVVKSLSNLTGSATVTSLWVPKRAMLTTAAAASISSTVATLGGNILRSDVSVTERGVVYSSSNTTPTIGGSGVTKATNGTGTGSFSQSISGLSVSTTYYARSYAISTAGTAYGDAVSFSTLSNDATLSALSLSSGSLNPVFSSATTSYTASIANATSTITITPTQNNGNASIKVNGTTVGSGGASGNISLNVGDNAQSIVVTAQDGTLKTYTVTVNRAKAAQTITFAPTASQTYGNADYAPGATSSSGLTVSYSSDNAAVATIVGGNVHIVAPGTANITASQAGDANNLAATSAVQALTVNNAAITVTASAASKIYGDADPSLTYSVTAGALVGSDAFSGSLTRDVGTNAGTYNITQGTLALNNKYTLTFVSGVLTVNKRPLSIQPAPASKSYGDADPAAYPYFFKVGSVAASDGMTGTFTRAPGEIPGTYALGLGTKRPVNATTGAEQINNYDLTFIPEYLTISKRAITLQPAPATKVYGDADPTFPYYFRAGSLAPGEGMTGTFGRQLGEDAGVYTLNLGTKRPVNSTTGVFTDQYYTISFLPENLTITQKTVNVSANTLSKNYGDVDQTLTYAADALGFSDTFSGTLTRAVGEIAGTYAISQGSLALNTNNYNLNFTGSVFTINTKIINVTANAQSKTYGDADPALTYTADALVNGDSFNGSLTRLAGEGAGSYAINQGSLALSSNYTLNFTGSNLTIGQKAINLTASTQTKAYGDADPALTYTADALINSDTFSGALARDAGETAGVYNINQGSLVLNANYALNYTGNTLTIGKGVLTYVATPVSKTYLAPNPAFTGTVTGFINGETQNSATTGTLSFTSTATDASLQGSYPINGSGLSAINYDFVQSAANTSALTVVLSPDAAVSNISISQGTLNTPFDANTYQYTANVDHSVTSFDLTAVVRQANATMVVNGVVLTSGSAITLPLSSGNNYFTIVVTAQDGTTTQNYLVTMNRAFSTNNLLSSITMSGVTLNPSFDSNTVSYTASVGNLTDGTDINVTTADVDATANVGGNPVSAGHPFHLPLMVGGNSFSVNGVAQNGDVKAYNITITRAASSDATLSSLNTTVLSFNEPFSSTTYNYTATVANNISQFNFVPVATNNAATITVNGNAVNYLGVTPTLNYGVNTYTIVVKSEDGTTTNTYTITVTRTLSSDNNLATLSIPFVISINEPFDPNLLNYTATLADSTITGLPLTAYSSDENASMKINGTPVVRFANYTMTLHGGVNTFNIVVTPQDNITPKTYTLVLTRAGQAPPLFSPNATLAAISVSATGYSYNFNFAFDALTPLNVANKITAVRLHPVTGDSGATTTVNGVAIAYDASTDLLPLNIGDNTFDVVVTAADGVHSTTTTLHVNRLPAADVSLASLTINAGTLNPVFTGTIFTYTASVPYSFSNLSVTPVANAAGSTITVNGNVIDAGNPIASVPLNLGLPNRIRVVVTAADGVNTQTYTVNVTRLAPDVTLSGLSISAGTLSPLFNPSTTSYTTSVKSSTISITSVSTDQNATVTINGNINTTNLPLHVGDNIFSVLVTAQNGTTVKEYTVKVTRIALSSDVTVKTLSISSGNLVRVGGSNTFTASVSPSVSTVSITAMPTDTNGTVKVNTIATVNGVASAPVALPGYTTTIPVLITAEDGVTTRAVTIIVSKGGSNNANIKTLSISSGLLTSIPGTGDYSVSVSRSTGSVAITCLPVDGTATLKINTVPTGNGVLSAPVILSSNMTTIPVLVTAEDGLTTKKVNILVSKMLSSDVTVKSLSISSGNLVRVGGSNTFTASVSPSVSTVSITAMPTDTNGTVKVNTIATVNGVASAPVALPGYTTTIPVLITAEDGVTTRAVTIIVSKGGSNNANIKTLSISSGLLTSIPGTGDYSVSVSRSTGSVAITCLPVDGTATLKINTVPTGNGVLSAPVILSSNMTTIPVLVTAEDGLTTKKVNILVSKMLSSDVTVKTLSISSGNLVRVGGSNTFTASVSPSVSTVSITAMPTDTNGTVKVNTIATVNGVASAPVALPGYTTTIPVLITAEDGVTTRAVTIIVSKGGSNNANIKSLSISSGLLTSIPGTGDYSVSVSRSTGSVAITCLPVDGTATLKINTVPTGNGVLSAPVILSSNMTTIPVLVTAEDGLTTKKVNILVSKMLSSDVTVKSLSISSGNLVRVGGSNTFTASVSPSVSTVSITAMPTDTNGTVKVNTIATVNGVASAPIALSTDTTIIPVLITAEDGVTTRAVTIIVSKTTIPSLVNSIVPSGIAKKSNDITIDQLVVHQAVSPNGDGLNDYLNIEGIEKYVDNHLSIMNAGGALVYDVKGYGSNGNLFDGHSNKNGSLQKPGTYYYSLEYKDGNETKRKTGFIILKY